MQGNGSIDLSMFDTKTVADQGYDLDIVDIRTGRPSGFRIRILGMDSKAVQDHMTAYQEEITERLKANSRSSSTPEEIEAKTLERLLIATTGWSENAVFDGQPFPFSRENAKKLYTDPRVPNIREQVERGIVNRVNFLRVNGTSS